MLVSHAYFALIKILKIKDKKKTKKKSQQFHVFDLKKGPLVRLFGNYINPPKGIH